MVGFTGWREPISISGAWQGRRRYTAPTALFVWRGRKSGSLSESHNRASLPRRRVICLQRQLLYARPDPLEDNPMSAEPMLTSDVIGLTKVAPFSRRGFMTASAAVTAGYTLAAGPVRADVIKTDTDGLTTGDAKIKVADAEMPAGYGAARRRRRSAVIWSQWRFSACMNTSRTSPGVSPSSARSPSRRIIISARASISPRSPTSRSCCRS